MKISITHLSKLANLKLSSMQLTTMEASIPSVVEHMEEIKHLDLSHIQATNAVIEEENIYREDVVEPSLSQKDALANAKNTYNGYFVVPYVFEEESNVNQ